MAKHKQITVLQETVRVQRIDSYGRFTSPLVAATRLVYLALKFRGFALLHPRLICCRQAPHKLSGSKNSTALPLNKCKS